MRLFKPVVVLITLLLGGLLCLALFPGLRWAWVANTFRIVTGQAATGQVQPLTGSDESEPAALAPSKKRSHRTAGHARASATNEPAEPLSAPEMASAGAPRRFPVANEIRPGTPRSVILAVYGRPNAVVTSTDAGRIRERFIYVDPETGSKTFIFFVESKVSETETFRQ